MMANQERLELVLQATDKASAQLQAVRKEIELARGSTDGTARSSLLAAQNQEKFGNNARRSAAAMSSIAFAAQSATLGTRGAVMAVGQLAEGAALTSMRFARFGPWIAAAVVAAGTLYSILDRINSKSAEITESSKYLLQNVPDEDVAAVFQNVRRAKEAAARAYDDALSNPLTTTHDQKKELKKSLDAAIELEKAWAARSRDVRMSAGRQAREDAKQERKRLDDEAKQQRKDAKEFHQRTIADLRDKRELVDMEVNGKSDYDVSARRIQLQRDAEIRGLEKYKLSAAERLELEKRIHGVHQAQANLLFQQTNSSIARLKAGALADVDDPRVSFDARMDLIAMERDAQIKAGMDVATATEISERKMRSLRIETARSTITYLKTIEDAMVGSSSKQIRAVGLLAQNIRRLYIGAEASLAAVESARAFGKVPGYLASHQYGSAALSGLAGLKLAAAAALGFRESLGGGGGGAGSGSGGGGATEASRFEPRAGSAGAGSGVTINLITRDPYGRESIQQTIYSLERAGVLKTPGIQVPTTNGLAAA